MNQISGDHPRGYLRLTAMVRAVLGGVLAGVVTCLIVGALLYVAAPDLLRGVIPVIAAGVAAGVASGMLFGSARRHRPSEAPVRA